MPTRRELERRWRLVAMLTPGQPAVLSREEAMAVLADVQRARRELERLMTVLRQLVDNTPVGSTRPQRRLRAKNALYGAAAEHQHHHDDDQDEDHRAKSDVHGPQ
jgi:hypothetical protein